MESQDTNKCQKAIHSRLIAMLGKAKYASITSKILDEQVLDFKDLNAYSIIPFSLIDEYMQVEERELSLSLIRHYKSVDPNKDITDRIVFVVLNFDIPNDEEDEDHISFKNASYICLLLCPPNFPQGPPHLYSVTPNGYYAKDHTGQEGTVICISIGSFHAGNYPASIGITGFSYAVYDMYYNAEKIMSNGGIGHIHMNGNTKLKRRLAANSREWNIQHFPTVIKAQHYLYRNVPTSFGYDFDIDLYKKAPTIPVEAPEVKKTFAGLKRRR